MARGVVGLAARLRPSVVGARRRQGDRLVGAGEVAGDLLGRLDHWNAGARQRLLFGRERIEVGDLGHAGQAVGAAGEDAGDGSGDQRGTRNSS